MSEYPELPEPEHKAEFDGMLWPEAYSADQMHAYADAVRAQVIEECAAYVELFVKYGYDFTGNAELHEAIRALAHQNKEGV